MPRRNPNEVVGVRTCEGCGQAFDFTYKDKIRTGGKRFCTPECYRSVVKEQTRRRLDAARYAPS